MDIEKVAGQHIQRGIGWKLEPKGLRVVGGRLDVGQLVRSGRFGLDAGSASHSRDAFYGIVSIGAISESGQIASVL